jgi:prevent-host-death family protein
MQINVHQAKTQLSHLLELVEQGETIVIARHGKPVAKLTKIDKCGLPIGIASEEPLVPPGDDWWQSMTDKECQEWLEGQ